MGPLPIRPAESLPFHTGADTFGSNLAAFAIFEIIELCVSQRSVTHTLNRLFGFRIDEIVVRRFKTRGAEYYRETRQNILRGSQLNMNKGRRVLGPGRKGPSEH